MGRGEGETIRVDVDLAPRMCDGDTLDADRPARVTVRNPDGARPLTAAATGKVTDTAVTVRIADGEAGRTYELDILARTVQRDTVGATVTADVAGF